MSLRISIYNEPAGSGIGGSEFVAALLAEAFGRDHHVDLYHRCESLTVEKFAANSGARLDNVRLHYVDKPNSQPQVSPLNPRAHYRALQKIQAELSEGYDIFVAIVHDVPPFSHAKKGALIVLFPTPSAPYVKPEGGVNARLALRHPGKYVYQSWAWKKRMESYEFKTAISEFSRVWAKRRWGIDCTIVYPPVNTSFNHVDKEKFILSVGRFAIRGEGHMKNQEEMLETYARMQTDWQYFCAGGVGPTPAHEVYFEQLSAIAAKSGARLFANLPHNELRNLYERASIFWHASGYREDQNVQPTLVEHFGISTVEAMAAGCVPVVINKGGQPEIVEHEVSGFVWDTLDELKDYTARLISDDDLRLRMSAAARKRAQTFSREMFLKNFVGRLLGATVDATDQEPHLDRVSTATR